MKANENTTKGCHNCGKPYVGHPALSRKDNRTPICPDCGTREALETLGIGVKEQEKILEIIRKNTRE